MSRVSLNDAVRDAANKYNDAAAATALPTHGGATAIYTDQQVVTGTATALTAQPLVNSVTVLAAKANAAPVMVGFSAAVTTAIDGSGIGFPLEPGASVTVKVDNCSDVFIIGTANDVVNVIGS